MNPSHPLTNLQGDAAGANPFLDEASLIALRRDMLRFAQLQLHSREAAEDVVQEALASASDALDRFEQRASVKTWIFSILKNKIIDTLRDGWHKRRIDIVSAEDEQDFDVLFNEKDRWRREEMPSDWGNPELAAENQQFWDVFEICINRMPEATARVFSMREFLGFEVTEICKEVGISSSNCWVILHRARMILRLCLQQRWFGEENPT